EFLLTSLEMPTSASQGIFKDRIVIRWTKPRKADGEGTLFDNKEEYILLRYVANGKGNLEPSAGNSKVLTPVDPKVWHEDGVVPGFRGDTAYFIDKGDDLQGKLVPGRHYFYRVARVITGGNHRWIGLEPIDAEGWIQPFEK